MEKWKEYRIKDVTSILGDGIHGTPKYDDNGTVYFINGNNLENGKIVIRDNTKRVSLEEASKHTKPLTDRTLFVSINGTLGNVARYKREPCILGKSACYFNVKEEFDVDFIYYVVANNEFRKEIERLATGTTIKNVSLETMRNYSFFAPSLLEQKKIASILKSLDDKIEVNRRINENLEQQAQALFKSWFVDFEPFKDGEFVESELGMIPKGWRVESLSSIADYINGLAMQKYRPKDDEMGLPVLKIKELGQGNIDSSSELCSPSLIGEKYIINDGDIIFSWSGTLMVKIWCGGQCGLNQHLFVVKPKDFPKWFVFYWTQYHLDNFIRIAKDKAVTMGHIKRGELDKALTLIPDENDMVKINAIMEQIINQIIINEKESRRLAELRDTLLPRLMSGEISFEKYNII